VLTGHAVRLLFRMIHLELFKEVSLPEFKHHQPPDSEIVVGPATEEFV
jgi:hypothetical protein